MSHKFKIGQTVQLTRDNARLANNAGNFRIVALRPSEGNDPHYLIKSDSERAQRIVAQSAILVDRS
jgi:hypothetical protein